MPGMWHLHFQRNSCLKLNTWHIAPSIFGMAAMPLPQSLLVCRNFCLKLPDRWPPRVPPIFRWCIVVFDELRCNRSRWKKYRWPELENKQWYHCRGWQMKVSFSINSYIVFFFRIQHVYSLLLYAFTAIFNLKDWMLIVEYLIDFCMIQ